MVEREPWTIDSGASQCVARKACFPESVLRESVGSRTGQTYRGPGKDIIKNEGEFDVLSTMHSGAQAKLTFQAAEVRSPLVAVSGLVDKGNVTVFDKESFILPSNAPELEMIRSLIQQIKNKIPMYRHKGIYKVRNWAPAAASGFPRPGR